MKGKYASSFAESERGGRTKMKDYKQAEDATSAWMKIQTGQNQPA